MFSKVALAGYAVTAVWLAYHFLYCDVCTPPVVRPPWIPRV